MVGSNPPKIPVLAVIIHLLTVLAEALLDFQAHWLKYARSWHAAKTPWTATAWLIPWPPCSRLCGAGTCHGVPLSSPLVGPACSLTSYSGSYSEPRTLHCIWSYGGHICSAMAKDQDIATLFINFSKAFDCSGPFWVSRSTRAKKIETLCPWLSLSGWICFIFVNKREQERGRKKRWQFVSRSSHTVNLQWTEFYGRKSVSTILLPDFIDGFQDKCNFLMLMI